MEVFLKTNLQSYLFSELSISFDYSQPSELNVPIGIVNLYEFENVNAGGTRVIQPSKQLSRSGFLYKFQLLISVLKQTETLADDIALVNLTNLINVIQKLSEVGMMPVIANSQYQSPTLFKGIKVINGKKIVQQVNTGNQAIADNSLYLGDAILFCEYRL